MKKDLVTTIIIIAMFLNSIFALASVPSFVEAASITNKNYAGVYYMKGGYKEVTEEHGAYHVIINSIKKDRVHLYVKYEDKNASPAYATNSITAKIKGKKALFKWHDTWGNSGRGTLQFIKKHKIKLNMKVTKSGFDNRATLDTNGAKLFLFLSKK